MWGTVSEEVEQEGIEVMVALDVSQSMLAQDIKPDRLSRTKMEIADLMAGLRGDEIGLVLFSGASFIQFPLTSDYATARAFLDNARPEVISRPGTAIGDAIRTAMAGFDMSRASQKVIGRVRQPCWGRRQAPKSRLPSQGRRAGRSGRCDPVPNAAPS